MENSNLPVEVKNNLPEKIKKAGLKALKIGGLSLATLGFTVATVGSIAFFPALAVPAIVGLAYTGQKLLNNTKYTSYKDLAFVTKKHGENIKIFQDFFRPSILKDFSKLNDIEKVGFMQLQAIVGISKFKSQEFNQENPTFETDTHSVLQKTFKSLESLGYINNYAENFKKTSNLIAPKLAMGNFKNLTEKTDFYNVQFNISDKKIDINDENLKKAFPLIFSEKRGILNKFSLVQTSNGSLEIDYKSNSNLKQTIPEKFPEKFRERYTSDISLREQKKFIKTKKNNYIDKKEIAKEK